MLKGPIAFGAHKTHKWEDISRSKDDPERATLIAARAHLAVVRALLERLASSTWQTGDLDL